MKEVSTSFLSDNNYEELIKKLNNTNTDYIHFDVMDGKFVNNKNLPLSELKKLLNLSKKKNDIHLMVKDPTKYIEALGFYDISLITVHSEIKDYEKYLDLIKSYGIRCGLSVNPNTDIENIYPVLDKVNVVLIMSVVPGQSGQKFIENIPEKVKKLKEKIKEKNLSTKIEIDGGVNEEVLDKLEDVDIIVSASYILKNFDNINTLKNL